MNSNSSIFSMFFTSQIGYYICTFLSILPLYYIILFCCFPKKTIKIRKIFSRITDLSDSSSSIKYSKYDPFVKIGKQHIQINKNEICGTFEQFKRSIPTSEEQEIANSYKIERSELSDLQEVIVPVEKEIMFFNLNISFIFSTNIQNYSFSWIIKGLGLNLRHVDYLERKGLLNTINTIT